MNINLGTPEIKKLIVEYYGEYHITDNDEVMYNAIVDGKQDIVTQLLNKGVKASGSCDTHSFLGTAVHVGNRDIATLLIKKGAVVSESKYKNEPLLMTAFRNRDLEIMRLLLDNGANANMILDFDANEDLLLTVAIGLPAGTLLKKPIIELLLEYGANPNQIDEFHNLTPLQYAQTIKDRDGMPAIIQLLEQYVELKQNSSNLN